MTTQLADMALIEPGTVEPAIGRPMPGIDSDPMSEDDRMAAGRGIVTAVLIAAPFWALIAFTVYCLL